MERCLRILCAVAIAAGSLWRLWRLDSIPYGLDIDEGAILYWARRSFAEGRWLAFSPEFTRWEMFPGYFYEAVAAVSGLARLGPALLGLAEIALVGVVARAVSGARAAWLAMALLSLCPWHLFYSRVPGTCVGVSLWMLTATWLVAKGRSPWWAHAAGILHYTVFRLFWGVRLVSALAARQWRVAGAAAGGAALAIVITAISGSPIGDLFSRGSYNLTRPRMDVVENLWATVLAPFTGLGPRYAHTTALFMADYVHGGLAEALAGAPPLGYGLALAAGVGLILLVGELARKRQAASALAREVPLVIIGLVALGPLGPSLSRLLWLTPWFALAGAHAIEALFRRGRGALALCAVTLVLASGAATQARVWAALGDRDRMEPFFHSRHRVIADWISRRIPDAHPGRVFWMTAGAYPSARYWEQRTSRFTLLPHLAPETTEPFLSASSSFSQTFIVDYVASRSPTISGYDHRPRLAENIARLQGRAEILEDEEILDDAGHPIGRRLEIRWPWAGYSRFSAH